MANILVRVDTGKTQAVVCVNLEGKRICSASSRFAGMGWLVRYIGGAGTPVILASDKKRPQKTVLKPATAFNALLFTPKNDISVVEKEGLSKNHVLGTVHERDVLSAAIAAYRHYSNKSRQAERKAKANGAYADSIKAPVIKRYSAYEAPWDKKPGRFVG